jgi:hypothetical protein
MRSNHIAFAFVALAATSSVPAADVTVGKLARVQAETTLMRAQLEQQGIATKLAAQGVPGITSQSSTPFVSGVFGRTGHLYATLLYADGSRIDARAGALVPGGYRVITLSAERVELLAPDGRRVLAAFSAVAPAQPVAPAVEKEPAAAPAKAAD